MPIVGRAPKFNSRLPDQGLKHHMNHAKIYSEPDLIANLLPRCRHGTSEWINWHPSRASGPDLVLAIAKYGPCTTDMNPGTTDMNSYHDMLANIIRLMDLSCLTWTSDL